MKMHKLLSIVFLSMFAIPFHASSQTNSVKADTMMKYTVDVSEFQELLVRGNINVIYKCLPDSAGYAIFHARAEETSRLLFSNPSGKLKIELSKDKKDNNDTVSVMPTVTVYSSILTKAENRGDSTLTVQKPSSGPDLKLKLEGNGSLIANDVHVKILDASTSTGHGTITVWGLCNEAKLSISGKGKINADRLTATSVRCSLFGGSEVSCFVNGGDLTLQGLSGATVYYRGRPSNIKNRATKVKIVNLDEADMKKPVN